MYNILIVCVALPRLSFGLHNHLPIKKDNWMETYYWSCVLVTYTLGSMFWFLLDGLEEIKRELCDEAHLVYSTGKPVGGTQLIHGIRYELGKRTPAASSNNSNTSFQASPVWVISISSGFRLHQQNLWTETVGNGGPLPVCQWLVVMVWLFSLPILFINVQCS